MNIQIIPAIDIMDGKCVRLTQGNFSRKKVYNEHPLEVARQFEDAGITRLHLVDLDGARAGVIKNRKVLEDIAKGTKLVIDFGGGIKTEEDLRMVFDSGARYATIGSLAVKEENTFIRWMEQYGNDRFLLGADVKKEKITVGGWLETTQVGIYDLIEKYIHHGIRQVFCTDTSKDGKLKGPATALYKKIIGRFPGLYFIASGGVSSMIDLITLSAIGCKGVIIGKALYEHRITLKELRYFNN